MRIRTRFALANFFVSLLAIIVANGISIYSINLRYKRIIEDKLNETVRMAESNFAIYLSDLNRKSYLLSEMREVIDEFDHPQELLSILEFKNFFFLNINIRILNKEKKLIVEKILNPEMALSESETATLPFFRESRDPLLRDGAILFVKDRIAFFSVSPIVDQNSFEIKGFVLLETPVNIEFAEFLKTNLRAEIFFLKHDQLLVSTLLDSKGNPIFPQALVALKNGNFTYASKGEYFFQTATISDFNQASGLRMIIAEDFSELLHSRKQGIFYLLLVSGLLTFVLIITSFVFGNRLSAPIIKLEHAAKEVASGNYTVQVSHVSSDELGSLSENFNQMVAALLIQRSEIEKLKVFFEKMVSYSPLGILVGNEQEEIILANDSLKKLFNLSADPVGLPIFSHFYFLKSLREDYLRVLFSGNVISYEAYQIVDQLQNERKLRIIISKILLQDSSAIMLQFDDVSSRYELEERLIHAQKLGSLGELLSKFTHEFNNLMTGLLGNLFLLKNEFTLGSALYDRVQLIEEIALKAQNLGRDILTFSRREKFQKEAINVAEEIDAVLGILSKTALKHIQVQKSYPLEKLFVVVNKEKFLLSIFNILVNARDAIEQSERRPGEISIRLKAVKQDEKSFVLLEIEDNGIGIEEKNLQRIFEPYFTTKGKKGTGLGLVQIKELVEENGGWVEVRSKVNCGTIFHIYLLAAEGRDVEERTRGESV